MKKNETISIPSPYHLHSILTLVRLSYSAKKWRKYEDGIKKVLLKYTENESIYCMEQPFFINKKKSYLEFSRQLFFICLEQSSFLVFCNQWFLFHRNFINSFLMTSTFKLAFKELCHDFVGFFIGHKSSGHDKDVCIVVLTCQTCYFGFPA